MVVLMKNLLITSLQKEAMTSSEFYRSSSIIYINDQWRFFVYRYVFRAGSRSKFSDNFSNARKKKG